MTEDRIMMIEHNVDEVMPVMNAEPLGGCNICGNGCYGFVCS